MTPAAAMHLTFTTALGPSLVALVWLSCQLSRRMRLAAALVTVTTFAVLIMWIVARVSATDAARRDYARRRTTGAPTGATVPAPFPSFR